MVLNLKELGATAATEDDGKQRVSSGGIEEKQSKLIDAIQKHIQVYVDGIPHMEETTDADGKVVKKKKRVNALSKPAKDNANDVIITLKYGNRAVIKIDGKSDSIRVAASQEKKTFETIIDAIRNGLFDAALEEAAKVSTPPKKK